MQPTVVILTKLPGHLPVKTRLWPVLGEAGARDLYVAMVRDTVELARAVTPRPILAYSPPGGEPLAAFPGIGECTLLPVHAAGGAACLEEALAAGYEGAPLLALGGDAPDLPAELLREVTTALERHDAALIPTGDGGFSCLGLRRPVPGLAEAFAYGSDGALEALERFLTARGLAVVRLAPWPDIDTPEDLAAYRRRVGRKSRW